MSPVHQHSPLLPPQENLPNFWFILGREPLLSTAEIFAFFHSLPKTHFLTPEILRISATVDAAAMMYRLGGTVKIAREIGSDLSADQLVPTMVTSALEVEGKIHFGISLYGAAANRIDTSEQWAIDIKGALKQAGRSARYITSDDGQLNSATVFHNHLDTKGREFLILPSENGTFALATTAAVQPIEDFSARDFGRPGRDDVSGMLPPKLAMMMINLAAQDSRMKIEDCTILDPFCGSGTIVSEAARLGFTSLIGTDISDKAILDTKQNIDWTINSLNLRSSVFSLQLQTTDVTILASVLTKHSADAIATEPYMGPPLRGHETPEQIKKTCTELAHLYTTAFEQFAKVLKPNGTVVFIVPRFFIQNQWLTISDKIIPKLKDLGFAKERLLPESITPTSYLLYHRTGQWVGREIWKFKKLA